MGMGYGNGAMPQPSPPAMPAGEGQEALDAIESNRSMLNPQDGAIMMSRLRQVIDSGKKPTLIEGLQLMGLNPEGDFQEEMLRWSRVQTGNTTALDKLDNIAQGNNVVPGAGAAAMTPQQSPEPEVMEGSPQGVDRLLGMV